MATESPSRGDDGASASERPTKRRRVAIACEACRTRKSRCDGVKPKCSTCRQTCTDCAYPPQVSKSDQLREELTAVTDGLEQRMGGIERLLERFESRLSGILPAGQTVVAAPSREEPSAPAEPATDEPDEIVLSCNALQDPGLNDSPADAIGIVPLTSRERCAFFGPSSNIAFLRLVSRCLAKATGRAPESIGPTVQSTVNGLSTRREHSPPQPSTGNGVGSPWAQSYDTKLKLPTERRARALLRNYFVDCGTVHPLIHEPSFMETFEEVSRSNYVKLRPGWLAMLYTMFALSALSGPSHRASTARVNPESESWYELAYSICIRQVFHENIANLDLVQCLTLLALYLQGTHNSYRIWMVFGLAVRVANQLGLHSKEASKVSSDPIEHEKRRRTWATILMLDTTLSMTFGRPRSVQDGRAHQDDPHVFADSERRGRIEEDQRSAIFMRANLDLWDVYATTISTLYSNNSGTRLELSLTSIASVLRLEHDIIHWSESLDPQVKVIPCAEISFLNETPLDDTSLNLRRFRVLLTLRYLNARILIHRSVLESLLEASSSNQPDLAHLKMMRQASANSLKVLVACTTRVISLLHTLVASKPRGTHLLGAWWFSLYYTFNSALAILATMLVSRPAWADAEMLTKNERESASIALDRSLHILDGLDEGHSTVSRCRAYLQDLISIACPLHDKPGTNTASASSAIPGAQIPDFSVLPQDFSQNGVQQTFAPDIDFENFLFPADLHAFGDTFAAFNQSLV